MKVISVLIACSTTVSAFSPATFGTKCMCIDRYIYVIIFSLRRDDKPRIAPTG